MTESKPKGFFEWHLKSWYFWAFMFVTFLTNISFWSIDYERSIFGVFSTLYWSLFSTVILYFPSLIGFIFLYEFYLRGFKEGRSKK
ncbi:MAG TPA: hypothetical protein ENH99_02815 [Candidatus Pacearchaeota archaeon]|nr:hypothetical protein [Candidatus Pacearchaeota archaeon]